MKEEKRRGDEAQAAYVKAMEDLYKLCGDGLGMDVNVDESEFPLRVGFVPRAQVGMFDEPADENGEVRELCVTVGMSVTVKNTMKFKMDAKALKKLIKEAEKLGYLYYLAYREKAGHVEEDLT